MKRLLFVWGVLMLALIPEVYSQTPEKIYVNCFRLGKKVYPLKGSMVEDLVIRSGEDYNHDSLLVKLNNGEEWKMNLRMIDSISFEEPRDVLQKELDLFVSRSIPTYADDYTTLNCSWSNRAKWNLANVHDPTVFKADDGYYYMYQTDASYGNTHEKSGGHFIARRSKDMVNWTVLGPVMKGSAPAWVKDSVNAVRTRMGLPELGSTSTNTPAYGYWAPVARKVKDGLYRLYYCIILDNYIKTGNQVNGNDFDGSWTERAYIGMMETTDPAGNVWEDKGYVICSSTDKSKTAYTRTNNTSDWTGYFRWNAIDPTYEITPEGEHWLIYGSWHSGMAAVQLDPETGKLPQWPGEPWKIGTGTKSTYGIKVATRTVGSRWQGSEGPEVIYNPETGYYYLFMAYDELSVAYNTRVARAKNITGPYYGMDGKNVTSGGDCYPVVTHPYKFNPANESQTVSGWVGFSHCAVWNDGLGNWFYSSQARLPQNYNGNAYSNAVMMGHVRNIKWTETGWPVVMPERYAGVPQLSVLKTEMVGNWENIDLSYSYGVQKTSATLTLNEDGTLGGCYTGTWQFDEGKQILTLTSSAGTFSLCVSREVDWEANPRKVTIVYGGYTSNGKKTLWGKKVE